MDTVPMYRLVLHRWASVPEYIGIVTAYEAACWAVTPGIQRVIVDHVETR